MLPSIGGHRFRPKQSRAFRIDEVYRRGAINLYDFGCKNNVGEEQTGRRDIGNYANDDSFNVCFVSAPLEIEINELFAIMLMHTALATITNF